MNPGNSGGVRNEGFGGSLFKQVKHMRTPPTGAGGDKKGHLNYGTKSVWKDESLAGNASQNRFSNFSQGRASPMQGNERGTKGRYFGKRTGVVKEDNKQSGKILRGKNASVSSSEHPDGPKWKTPFQIAVLRENQ